MVRIADQMNFVERTRDAKPRGIYERGRDYFLDEQEPESTSAWMRRSNSIEQNRTLGTMDSALSVMSTARAPTGFSAYEQ